ncbi:MAG: flavin reductase family protein, partial [Clostridia bacterium]|nr:flavin reductase family protein [Clostridia bacterium]
MGRTNFGAKPLCYPQPVFIIATYNEDGSANAMNAAWGGISEENEISMCLSANHKTTYNFERTGAFTVSMAEKDYVVSCDYLGIASGNKVNNKLGKAGFTVSKSEFVDAPIINELSVCLECKVKSYDKDTCRLVGEIVNVSVDEKAIKDGKVDINAIKPIIFDAFN